MSKVKNFWKIWKPISSHTLITCQMFRVKVHKNQWLIETVFKVSFSLSSLYMWWVQQHLIFIRICRNNQPKINIIEKPRSALWPIYFLGRHFGLELCKNILCKYLLVLDFPPDNPYLGVRARLRQQHGVVPKRVVVTVGGG